jgi:uncharacterized protein (TIGR02594 family)
MTRTTEDRHLSLLVQEALKARGIDPGPLDGLWGGKTEAAWEKFRGNYAFNSEPKPTPVPVMGPTPAWLTVAQGELGVSEIPGSKDNARIVEYHQATSLNASDDETPWCSSFVNWCLSQSGYKGTDNAMARSFLNWGRVIALPQKGCVVVFKRGKPPQGHVAFFLEDAGMGIRVLGGNQGDKVSTTSYPKSDVIGYRWPA